MLILVNFYFIIDSYGGESLISSIKRSECRMLYKIQFNYDLRYRMGRDSLNYSDQYVLIRCSTKSFFMKNSEISFLERHNSEMRKEGCLNWKWIYGINPLIISDEGVLNQTNVSAISMKEVSKIFPAEISQKNHNIVDTNISEKRSEISSIPCNNKDYNIDITFNCSGEALLNTENEYDCQQNFQT
ncbi:MAG: hypothetical protein ISN64_02180 [Rickettsia sp.]|nr:hypothetical protein [Rickettsia sp.]